ncbi:MAG: MFS transporter [Actinobacteria bacterium]|nr:MFS transporter [Actinomycetota bacterium]
MNSMNTPLHTSSEKWRTHDVWAISLSAFFADLGYQGVLAGLPLFMVIALHASVALYGLAMALGFGGGSLIAYLGSRLGDRIGHRKLAIIGNSAIPLLSLTALVASPVAAITFFCTGWWARNLRSPSRRVMLTKSTIESTRTQAFGFLHALDIGGGIFAGIYMIVSIAEGLSYRYVFLGTIIPLVVSTFCLTITDHGLDHSPDGQPAPHIKSNKSDALPANESASSEIDAGTAGNPATTTTPAADTGVAAIATTTAADAAVAITATDTGVTAGPIGKAVTASSGIPPTGSSTSSSGKPPTGSSGKPILPRNAILAILAATVLFGFSSYSVGFPILTASRGAHSPALGLVAFLVFNTVSAATGMTLSGYLGSTWHRRFRNLGIFGYLPAAIGAALLGISAALKLPYLVILLSIAILGLSLGIVETLEPSIMSVIRPEGGSGFGLLSAYRSAGLFAGNLIMGLLYTLGAAWSYGYAAIVAFAGASILLLTMRSRGWSRNA